MKLPFELFVFQILQILAEEHEIQVVPDFMSDRVIVDGQEHEVKFGMPIIKYKTIAYGQSVFFSLLSMSSMFHCR